jgi:hypothetical protein
MNPWVEAAAKKQINGIQSLFKEIIAENFSNLGNDRTSRYRIHLEPQIDVTSK